MECHVSQHHRQVGQQCGGVVQQVVDQQTDVLELLLTDLQPPARVQGAQVAVAVVIVITVVIVIVIVVAVVSWSSS